MDQNWVDDQGRGADAYVLRAAARVLKRRSRRPKSFMLGVLTCVLENTARRIEAGRLDG